MEGDREQADLLLIIGTSLKVAPVSDIISTSYNVLVEVKYDDPSTSALAPFHPTSMRSPRLANVLDDIFFMSDSDQQNTSDSYQSGCLCSAC